MKYSLIVCLLALRLAKCLPTEKSQQNMGQYLEVDPSADSNQFNERDLEIDQQVNNELNVESENQSNGAQVEPAENNGESFFDANELNSSEQTDVNNTEMENTQSDTYESVDDQIENYDAQNAPFDFKSFEGKKGAGSINEIEWPDAWCEKECRETFLLYEGCKKQGELIGETCVCSVHFRYKVNKCQADGCQHYYNQQPEWQKLMEKYVEECKDKGTDFVNY